MVKANDREKAIGYLNASRYALEKANFHLIKVNATHATRQKLNRIHNEISKMVEKEKGKNV